MLQYFQQFLPFEGLGEIPGKRIKIHRKFSFFPDEIERILIGWNDSFRVQNDLAGQKMEKPGTCLRLVGIVF